ncbi:MAG: hypothetical protein HYX52_06870 [Chloroflexi bacterium]|nr:hypothetical protein [Chloroflexota bacterium]
MNPARPTLGCVRPQAVCRALLREYERQWRRAGGHATRHPLRLKMDKLPAWCSQDLEADAFETRLAATIQSEDVGESLLAEELTALWRYVQREGSLPFNDNEPSRG